MKLFREAYLSSTIFPQLSFEKWQEMGQPDAGKILRQRTMDLISSSNYPDDQKELLEKWEYLISHNQLLSTR
jgi:trimethylamine:corrinoid methyltransferase-like protein